MFPGWYDNTDGRFPDIEKLLETFFAPLLPDVIFVPWFPTPDVYQQQLQTGAIVRFARTGGRFNFDQNRDEPRVQAAALANSRQLSWDLIEFIRQILWDGFKKAALVPGTKFQMEVSEEVLGPQLIPDIMEPRLVPVTFGFYTWKPRSPNYRQALGL